MEKFIGSQNPHKTKIYLVSAVRICMYSCWLTAILIDIFLKSLVCLKINKSPTESLRQFPVVSFAMPSSVRGLQPPDILCQKPKGHSQSCFLNFLCHFHQLLSRQLPNVPNVSQAHLQYRLQHLLAGPLHLPFKRASGFYPWFLTSFNPTSMEKQRLSLNTISNLKPFTGLLFHLRCNIHI